MEQGTSQQFYGPNNNQLFSINNEKAAFIGNHRLNNNEYEDVSSADESYEESDDNEKYKELNSIKTDEEDNDYRHLDEINSLQERLETHLTLYLQQPTNVDYQYLLNENINNTHSFDYFFNYQPVFFQPKSIVPKTSFTDLFINTENLNLLFQISMIRDKVYHLYLELTDPLQKDLNRAQHLIRNKITKFDGDDATKEEAWFNFMKTLTVHSQALIMMAKELPGFNNLCLKDFNSIIKENITMTFGIKITKFYTEDECYFMIGDIQMTKRWLSKFFGVRFKDFIFEFHRKIRNLKLNNREIALLFPFILTYSSMLYNLIFYSRS